MDVNDYFQAIFGYFLAVNMFVMLIVYLGLYKWWDWQLRRDQCKYSTLPNSISDEQKVTLETHIDKQELDED